MYIKPNCSRSGSDSTTWLAENTQNLWSSRMRHALHIQESGKGNRLQMSFTAWKLMFPRKPSFWAGSGRPLSAQLRLARVEVPELRGSDVKNLSPWFSFSYCRSLLATHKLEYVPIIATQVTAPSSLKLRQLTVHLVWAMHFTLWTVGTFNTTCPVQENVEKLSRKCFAAFDQTAPVV